MLQAAWAQVLMMLTGHRDVAFGTAVSGRPAELAGVDSIVGLLINTVPVRAKAGADTTVADLLAEVQRHHNDTLEHEHLPLTEIHHLAGQDHLFDTLFLYESYPIDTSAFMGVHELTVTDFTSREYNHYPLSVMALPGAEMGLRVEYDTHAFDSSRIATVVTRFQRVLEAMTADATQRLSAIDALDDAEHDQLAGWGNAAVLAEAEPTPLSIPEVFAAQVAQTPDAPAVTFDARSMSYAELDEGVQPAGEPAGRAGCRRGTDRDPAAAALGPGDRGDDGRRQDRGRLPGDGSGRSGYAAGVHARRRRAGRGDHHRTVAFQVGRARSPHRRHRRRIHRCPARHGAARAIGR